MPLLSLTKHQGLGNDFLVLLDLDEASPIDADMARALCDRRFGVGADGLIRVTRGGAEADLRMELRNADGSVAELSGNGLRCVGQAAIDAGVVAGPTVSVATAAGVRRLEVQPVTATTAWVSVDMGKAEVGPDQPQDFPDRKARTVDIGNPHLVLIGPDPASVDVAALGSRLEASFTGGVNVEFVMVGPEPDALTMRVWERGVGETMACGTGACAAAAAANAWGLVGERVTVHQLGGDAEVELRADGVLLSGPTRRIARIEAEL